MKIISLKIFSISGHYNVSCEIKINVNVLLTTLTVKNIKIQKIFLRHYVIHLNIELSLNLYFTAHTRRTDITGNSSSNTDANMISLSTRIQRPALESPNPIQAIVNINTNGPLLTAKISQRISRKKAFSILYVTGNDIICRIEIEIALKFKTLSIINIH